jgi:methionyl-tRNA formyltransferase
VSLAYLGTSEFAVGVLRRLAGTRFRPALVVTRPNRPRGRGSQLASPPVADAALELGLPLAQPDDVHALEFDEHDHVVVCAFGALLKEPILSHPGLLNVHPSLLPRWRGAAPIERAMMAGDERTGVCIMRVVEALDAGPVCACADVPIAPDDTYGTLSARLVEVASELLLATLAKPPECAEQGEDGATYAEKIGPADRQLRADEPPEANERIVRALTPHIGAKAGELGVWAARARPGTGPGDGELAVEDSRLVWGCGDGLLELLEVQPPGGKRMSAAAYIRGHRG